MVVVLVAFHEPRPVRLGEPVRFAQITVGHAGVQLLATFERLKDELFALKRLFAFCFQHVEQVGVLLFAELLTFLIGTVESEFR